jgi:hypothetical protein
MNFTSRARWRQYRLRVRNQAREMLRPNKSFAPRLIATVLGPGKLREVYLSLVLVEDRRFRIGYRKYSATVECRDTLFPVDTLENLASPKRLRIAGKRCSKAKRGEILEKAASSTHRYIWTALDAIYQCVGGACGGNSDPMR